MDVSNKFLAILLLITIVITLIGAWYSIDRLNKLTWISGRDVFGFVNVTISNQTTINVTATNCAFGTGYVTPPYSFAVLSPGSAGDCSSDNDVMDNWTNTTEYNPDCMEVRNDGNIDLKINVSSGKDANGFITGTNPEYKVWSQDKELDMSLGSCVNGEVNYPGIEMNTSNITICSSLKPQNDTDEMYVGCYLKIPDNAFGVRGDVWTFWAEPAT